VVVGAGLRVGVTATTVFDMFFSALEVHVAVLMARVGVLLRTGVDATTALLLVDGLWSLLLGGVDMLRI
jgi:hypothetical protein